MAAQQIQFAETIRAMKLAMRRQRASSPGVSSDEDEPALRTHTNRGHKLNPRAQYVREGCLDDTGGISYKRRISHAGYQRHIIAKRPKLYDNDGDVVDPRDFPSDADEDAHVYGEPIRDDAFGDVRLEELLRPLTSAAELRQHPSLSRAYTNKALTQMAEEAAEMVRREKACLWKAKRLLERFRGDGAWMAGGRFETEQDELLLPNGLEAEVGVGGQSMDMELSVPEFEAHMVPENGVVEDGLPATSAFADTDAQAEGMEGVEARDHVENAPLREQHPLEEANTGTDEPPLEPQVKTNGLQDPTLTDLQQEEASSGDSASASTANAPSHGMTTRARARSPQLAASPSPSPSSSASIPTINPWFLPPPSALPDRDLGLPSAEAEDTRKLLLLYVQKQENIVRQLGTLYDGLQRVDRLRQDVFQSCKAEAHVVPDGKGGLVTEMSDGEDWYDEQVHGRLEKGKDEVDDLAEEEGRRVGGRRRRVVGR